MGLGVWGLALGPERLREHHMCSVTALEGHDKQVGDPKL